MKKNILYYPARFKFEDDQVLVSFVDFDNVFTFGKDFNDAYHMAQDVLYNYIIELNENLPNPTQNYTNINTEKDEIISMVQLDFIEYDKKVSKKIVNTTVTMPQWLKDLAERQGINFSKLLQEKLKEELNIID